MSGNRRNRKRRYLRRRSKKSSFSRMKLWKKILLIVALVLIFVLFGMAWYVFAKWDKVDTQVIRAEDLIINQEVKQNKEVDLGSGYTNVALFGVDSRDGNLGKGNRTDCIIVASLNNETKEIRMVSVYRDTLLDLSEGTYQKCNAAYSYGGPIMAINMLNMNLDLDIEDYVTVDFGAIADAIDLLGGVEIEVTEEEIPYINEYIPETARSAGKEVNYIGSAGVQTLDGTQATTYARIRSTAGGDFKRTERQRLVIEKMFEKALEADLGTINKIIDAVFPQISTSFTLQELLLYASAYGEYTLGENMGFPVDKTTDTLSGLGSIVIPQDLTSNVSLLHEFLFGTQGYVPSSTVQRINGNIISTVNSADTEPENDYESHEYPSEGEAYSEGTDSNGINENYGSGDNVEWDEYEDSGINTDVPGDGDYSENGTEDNVDDSEGSGVQLPDNEEVDTGTDISQTE